MQKSISKVISKAFKQAKIFLSKAFPNLFFYISPTGDISCWVKTFNGDSGSGICLPHKINIGQILSHEWECLTVLNIKAELAHLKPNEYFWCTECSQSLPMEEYGYFVMAAEYCKECAKKPEIAALITESHRKGFYD